MRPRITFFVIAMMALVIMVGCGRAPAMPTATFSGLVIITPTNPPSSTATSVSGYPGPAQATQEIIYPTAYPPPAVTPVEPLSTEASPAAGTPYPAPEDITSTVTLAVADTATSTTAVMETSTLAPVAASVTPTPIGAYPGVVNAPTFPAYPGLQVSTPTPPGAYPGPISTPTPSGTYPGPISGTPTATSQATVLPTGVVLPSPTLAFTGTPLAIPMEFPLVPPSTPPSPGSLVRIWVAWNQEQFNALDRVIDSFQDIYPSIRFEVINIPQADLRRRYETAAYYQRGPSLLIAPAEWGPAYFDSGLVSELYPYTSAEFLATINPAALNAGRYKGSLICLPIAQEGVVLFRNIELIPAPADTFEELTSAARAATRGGNLGAYLDRGASFSAANISGLGGELMDRYQHPEFNSSAGLAWLDLMRAYDVAGAVGLNTNRDLDLFKTGRIGYIIEGTWQIDSIALAIGEENLAIDPWPDFGSGHLSGFVQTEAVFLNPNVRASDRYSALLFMGYLLTSDVQQYLAEFGMIPAALEANPRPMFIAQAARALERGTAYPPVSDPQVLTAYWEGLEMAIQAVFSRLDDPQDALDSAEDWVQQRLLGLRP